jgi:hypothetical protein
MYHESCIPPRVTDGGARTLLGFFQFGCSFFADATQPLPPASSSLADGKSPYKLMLLRCLGVTDEAVAAAGVLLLLMLGGTPPVRPAPSLMHGYHNQ